MGAVGAHVSPGVLKRLLELEGFSVHDEDDDNWVLGRDGLDDLVIVPKAGAAVARHVVQAVFSVARISRRGYLFTGDPHRAGMRVVVS
jgi:hypothetical protein